MEKKKIPREVIVIIAIAVFLLIFNVGKRIVYAVTIEVAPGAVPDMVILSNLEGKYVEITDSDEINELMETLDGIVVTGVGGKLNLPSLFNFSPGAYSSMDKMTFVYDGMEVFGYYYSTNYVRYGRRAYIFSGNPLEKYITMLHESEIVE